MSGFKDYSAKVEHPSRFWRGSHRQVARNPVRTIIRFVACLPTMRIVSIRLDRHEPNLFSSYSLDPYFYESCLFLLVLTRRPLQGYGLLSLGRDQVSATADVLHRISLL